MSTKGLVHDAENHLYFFNGVRILSVTDVLKIVGIMDHMRGSEYDLWAGQCRHKAVELHIKGTLNLATLHPDIAPSIKAYLTFEKNTGFIPKETEKEYYSESLRLATRPDLVGIFPDGSEGIVELKSGTVAKPTALQTAGQDITMGGPRRRRFGLGGLKDGQPRIHPYGRQDDYRIFTSCLNTAHWKVEHLGHKF